MLHVPGGAKHVAVEEPPASNGDEQNRNEPYGHRGRLDLTDESWAYDIGERQQPNDSDLGGRAVDRRGESGKEAREVTDRGHRDGDVPDPAGDPVQSACLEAHVATHCLTGIGAGAAGFGRQLRQFGEHEGHQQCADRSDPPADDRDAADARERGGEQKDPGSDHIAGDQHRGEERTDLLVADQPIPRLTEPSPLLYDRSTTLRQRHFHHGLCPRRPATDPSWIPWTTKT